MKIRLLIIVLFCQSFVQEIKSQACSDVPVINNFTPITGFIGSTVTINGANFDPINISNNVVYFGATRASVIDATFGQLKVIVPVGASTAPISVRNKCGLVAYSSVAFNGVFCPTPLNSQTYAASSSISPVSPYVLNVTTGSYNMISADFDLDGKPEIVSAGLSGANISVAINKSTVGNLLFTTLNLTDNNPRSPRAADMDGDGKLDLVTPAGVHRNTSSGPGNVSFAPIVSKNDVASYQIDVADINNDGKLDIIGSDGDLKVALNTSSGPGNISFLPAQTILTNFGSCTGVRAADIDKDGKIDFFGSQGSNNRGASARNTTIPGSTTVTFEPAEYWASDDPNDALGVGQYPYRLMMADFDKDDKIDFASPNYSGATSVAVWRNNSVIGDIRFDQVKNFASPSANYRIGVGDVDGDGRPDIVTKSSSSNVFSAYRNISTGNGDINFAQRIDYQDTYASGEISGIVIGDLDGDYVPDIALSGTSSRSIRIYRNRSVQVDTENPIAKAKNIIRGLGTTGSVTISAEDIDDGSSDACGIANIVLSKTIFTCSDIGSNTVTLTVTDRSGNVSTTNAIVNIQAAAIITTGQTTVCAGQTVTMTANEGDNYQWYKDGTLINGATLRSYTASVSGAYTVQVTNNAGCSGISVPTQVTINLAPTITVIPNGQTFICGSQKPELIAAESSLYQWIKDGTDIAGVTQRSFIPSVVGDYKVRVVDFFGCTATSDAINVTSGNPPVLGITRNASPVLNNSIINLGTVNKGQPFSSIFTLSNSGQSNLRISMVEFTGTGSSGFSVATPVVPFEVGIGASSDLNVTFNPSEAGTSTVQMRIISNDCSVQNFIVNYTATTPENSPPTDFSISASSVNENVATGTTIGSLSATDVDAGDTFTYS
ncbi:MAG: hypothetical protein B7Y37_14320, partial [Sphingobacteriia bacterium 28-36-52]